MYFDKNRLVVFRDGDGFTGHLYIAYPNSDGTKYYFVALEKVVPANEIKMYKCGGFEDMPIVLVKNKNKKSEIKRFQSVRILSKEDVLSLEKHINKKHYEYGNDYMLENLVVVTLKNDATQDLLICEKQEDGSLYAISQNKMIAAEEVEVIGEFETIYANVKFSHSKQVIGIFELTERDVNSLEDKFNNEKIAYSVNDRNNDLNF